MLTASKLKYPEIKRTPAGGAKTPGENYMTRIVNDASRRVKELKRQQSLADETQIVYKSPTKGNNSDSGASRTLDEIYEEKGDANDLSGLVSGAGQAFEWSPKNSPKQKKKKGFVKLSNYDNACFSQTSL